MIKTERLILRKWRSEDAKQMYELCKDPDIGPKAGWPPHRDVYESNFIIDNVLTGPEAYAICFKEDENKPIGCIELKMKDCEIAKSADECEFGYWLGKPYWGQGIMPEAAKSLIDRAFTKLGINKIWIVYYDGNDNSGKVAKKLGFKYQRTIPDLAVPLLQETRVAHVNLLTREDWEKSQ